MTDDRNAPRNGQLADEHARHEPVGALGPTEVGRRDSGSLPPATLADLTPGPGMPPFRRISNGSSSRRGPSYPAWERPLTPHEFPRLYRRRGRSSARFIWPAIFAVVGVALVAFVAVAVVALRSHSGGVAVESPTSTVAVSAMSSVSAAPSPSGGFLASPSIPFSPTPTPTGPQPSYRQYKIQAGDTLTRIATKYGLKTSELLLANPGLTATSSLKIGMFINIPAPGQMTATATPTSTPPPY